MLRSDELRVVAYSCPFNQGQFTLSKVKVEDNRNLFKSTKAISLIVYELLVSQNVIGKTIHLDTIHFQPIERLPLVLVKN